MPIMRTVALTLLLFLLPATARDEPLRLAFEHYPPFEYMESGQLVGKNAALVNEVCRRLGLEPEFVEVPFARALYCIEEGSIDGLFSLFQTPERREIMFYAEEPLGETRTAVVTRPGLGVAWSGLESLKKHSVGRVRGYSHGPEVDALDGPNVTEVTDSILLTKMLHSGRIDMALCNLDVLRHVHDTLGFEWEIVVLEHLECNPLYIGFSRALGQRGRNLAKSFAREIKAIRKKKP